MKRRLVTKNKINPPKEFDICEFLKIPPSLDKLLLKGRINQEEYNALCTGDRNDILLAFNLEMFSDNDDHVRSILIKKGVEDFNKSEEYEVSR